MSTKKQVLIFLAGAEAFHTFVHFYLWATNQSFHAFSFTIGRTWNLLAFVINALITIGLLYWASRIK